MESRLHGVPISATRMTPKAAPLCSTTSGIRAPLTVDESEFEYSVSSKSHKNSTTSSYCSGSELESEGFVSGEDEFETASERPYVTDQDEEILEETHFLKEYAVSKGSMVKPSSEMVRVSSNSSEHGFSRPFVKSPGEVFARESGFRPFVRNPNETIYKGISYVYDSDDSRPYLSDSGDEVVEDEDSVLSNSDSRSLLAVSDEKVSEGEPMQAVDIKIPLVQKLPIAQISGDSDDDSESSVVLEDSGFSGIVRVPSIEVLHRVNSAPKVRISEVGEGDDDESQVENVAEMEFGKDLVVSKGVWGPEDEKEHIGVEDTIHCDVSADMIQDKAPDDHKEPRTNSLVVNEADNSISESELNAYLMHLDEKIQEFDATDDNRKCVVLVDCREPTDLAEGTVFPGSISCVASAKLTEPEVTELSSRNFGATSLDDEDPKSNNTSLESNLVSNQNIESEKLESESAQEIDQIVECFSSIAADKIESDNQCFDIKEVPCPQFSELSEVLIESVQVDMSDNLLKDADLIHVSNACQSVLQDTKLDQELPWEVENSTFHTEAMVAAMEKEQDFNSLSGGEISLDRLQESDDPIVIDSDEGVDADGGISNHRQIIDSAALAAFFKAIGGAVSYDSAVKITSIDGIENFSLESDSTDLGSKFLSTRPIIEARSPNLSEPSLTNGELEETVSEGEKKKLEKIQQIRVKYLWLLHRLGRSPEDSVASKVLHQLKTAEVRSSSQAFLLNSGKKVAMELEAQTKDDVGFSVSILVIGKTGVGKSATINSIFGEQKTVTDAFEPATTHVKEITGVIDGIKVKVFDTPGLRTSLIDQSINRKILSSIKKLMKKSPPDVILYVDRLDAQTSSLDDLPVLKSITSYLGSSIWRKSIVALTHATSIPPDGPDGYPLNYEIFVAQRSRFVQQLISHSAEELLVMNPASMIPISLVENHPLAEKNGHGETLLHNGESWRQQLLLLCCSVKILSEVSSVVMIQNPLNHRKLFGLHIRPPSLPCCFSSLLQPNVHPKLSNDQNGDAVDSDVELCYSSDSDQEDGIEYDNLPPFQPLKKSQIAKLSRDQREAYFEECDYRVKLHQKKQLREEIRRFRDSKKVRNGAENETYMEGLVDQETGSTETAAVPLPDMALPPSFDGDSPSFRYRLLEPSSQLLTRPVFYSHGWDHDFGYDGVVMEDKIDIASHFPAVISVQLAKDKKEFSIQLHSSVSAKHGDKVSTMAGLDIQTFGKKLAYILKGETKVRNLKKNKTAAGVSITFLGGNVVTGFKVEDHIAIGKRIMLMGNAGVAQSQEDAAYGANLDLCRRGKDYPIYQDQISLGLSIMRYRGDIICGCSLQAQFSVVRNSKLNVSGGLNNKLSGQISVKTSCSDQLQVAALALLPITKAIFKKIFTKRT